MYKMQLGPGILVTINVPKPVYGGFATPFGIRVYSNYACAGVTNLKMVMTAVVYSVLIFLSHYAIEYTEALNKITIEPYLKSLIGVGLYLSMFRLTPISAIHASEHQVIHALDAEIELTPESVGEQNRVHLSCGTNFVAWFLIFSLCLALASKTAMSDIWQVLCIIPSWIMASRLSKRFGGFLQKYLTTKPARKKDIEESIKVALEHNINAVQYITKNHKVLSPMRDLIMYLHNSGLAYMIPINIAVISLLTALFPVPKF